MTPSGYSRCDWQLIDVEGWISVCIRVESSWAMSRNDNAKFIVGMADSSFTEPQTSNLTSVNIYSANQSVYFKHINPILRKARR